MRRILSILLTVIIVFSFAAVGTVGAKGETPVNRAAVVTKLDALVKKYVGTYWTDSFNGGTQCFGFAALVEYNIFGKTDTGSYRNWNYDGTSLNGMKKIGSITNFSAANVQKLLSSALPGDVLQFNNAKPHTMVIYSVGSDSVKVFDCNWDWKCGVQLRTSAFGAWSSRNSTKLSLLRATNSTGGSESGETTEPEIEPLIFANKTVTDVNGSISFTGGGMDECSKIMFYLRKNGDVYYSKDVTNTSFLNYKFTEAGTFYASVSGYYGSKWYLSAELKISVTGDTNGVFTMESLNGKRTTMYLYYYGETYKNISAHNGVFEFDKLDSGLYDVYVKPENGLLTLVAQYLEIKEGNNEVALDDIYVPMGDVNGDGVVDINDVSTCLSSEVFGNAGSACDLDLDGTVTVNDVALILLKTNYGKSAAVPEE